MSYDLSFGPVEDLETEVRTLIGITTEELTDDEINSKVILGAAEIELLDLLPTVVTLLADNTLERSKRVRIELAFINLVAKAAYPGLKLKLLQTETDNKSTATRFKDVLAKDEKLFSAKAVGLLNSTGLMLTSDNVALLEFISPASNEITGA